MQKICDCLQSQAQRFGHHAEMKSAGLMNPARISNVDNSLVFGWRILLIRSAIRRALRSLGCVGADCAFLGCVRSACR